MYQNAAFIKWKEKVVQKSFLSTKQERKKGKFSSSFMSLRVSFEKESGNENLY
jgi:hypothetical protein